MSHIRTPQLTNSSLCSINNHPSPLFPLHHTPSSTIPQTPSSHLSAQTTKMSIHSWVSEHKLTTIGAVWATGIGASFLANSCKTSAMKPSLRLIHARMHAQALTLAVLSGAAAYHYYENRLSTSAFASEGSKPEMEICTDIKKMVEWEVLAPF